MDNSQFESNNVESSIKMEIISYLREKCVDDIDDLTVLNQYPLLRKVFIEFNTILPSSAPVERVFSYASEYIRFYEEQENVLMRFLFLFSEMILRPQRQNLSDNLFEQLLILKTNRLFNNEVKMT